MLLVVCDSSPLIYLARLGRLEFLPHFHEAVLIPPAVWDEVAVGGANWPEGQQLREAVSKGWLRVEKPQGRLHSDQIDSGDLDPGEAEAIQLAIETQAILAIDEAHGRAVAHQFGLKITGTVGLLIRARRENLLPSLKHELDRLRSETTFRISDDLYLDALRLVGESN
jgi:uncharacterized protein